MQVRRKDACLCASARRQMRRTSRKDETERSRSRFSTVSYWEHLSVRSIQSRTSKDFAENSHSVATEWEFSYMSRIVRIQKMGCFSALPEAEYRYISNIRTLFSEKNRGRFP